MNELAINTVSQDQIVLVESEVNKVEAVCLDVLTKEGHVFAHLSPVEAVNLASGLLQYATEQLKG